MRRFLISVLALSIAAVGCAPGPAPVTKPAIPGIAPLDHATLVRAKAAADLKPDELVLGVSLNGDPRAYPLRALAGHFVANDSFAGVNVAVAWCPSCGSLAAFRTDTPKGTLTLAAAGAPEGGEMLLADRQTGTVWNPLNGAPVRGSLAGSETRLQPLPVVLTTWGSWVAAYPETRTILPAADQPAVADPPNPDLVFGLVVNGAARAYPVDRLVKEGIVNDELGGRAVVIVAEPKADPAGRTIRAYERRDRTFSRSGRTVFGLTFLNDQTGRAWRAGEEALMLPDKTALPRLPGFLAKAEAWAAAYPGP